MIIEKAEELGRLIGQSDDYRAVQRVRETLKEAKELHGRLERLEQLAETFERQAQAGQGPTAEEKSEYETLLSAIQADSRYQQLVAAQSNLDKLMHSVNQHIMRGVSKAGESRIITLD